MVVGTLLTNDRYGRLMNKNWWLKEMSTLHRKFCFVGEIMIWTINVLELTPHPSMQSQHARQKKKVSCRTQTPIDQTDTSGSTGFFSFSTNVIVPRDGQNQCQIHSSRCVPIHLLALAR